MIDGGGSTSYVTNALNQYTSVGNVQYLYDKAGNTTYDGGSNMYAYDAENRLLTVTKTPDALSGRMRYQLDPDHRRHRHLVGPNRRGRSLSL